MDKTYFLNQVTLYFTDQQACDAGLKVVFDDQNEAAQYIFDNIALF